MEPLTPCPCCGERDPDSRARKAGRLHCLNCGNVWDDGPPTATAVRAATSHGPSVGSVVELIELLRTPDNGLGRLARVLASGELRIYLESRRDLEEPLRSQLGALLARLRGNPRLTLFALRYALTDDPLELAPGVTIRSPAEIGPLVDPSARSREAVLTALRDLVADGRLGEWLRCLDPKAWERAIGSMEAARREYPKESDLPLYALLWHQAPDLGFPVDGRWMKTPKALAAWIDADKGRADRGLDLLDRGWIPTWLVSTGRLDDHRSLRERVPVGLTRGARVETLLHLLDVKLADPRVVVRPARLTARVTESGAETLLQVTLKNTGRGHAWGEVSLEGDARGLDLGAGSFDGTPATVTVKVAPARIPGPGTHRSALQIRVKNSREDQILRVPIRVRLRVPLGGIFAGSLIFGVVLAAALGFVRWLVGQALPAHLYPTPSWISAADLEGLLETRGGDGIILGVAVLALLLVGTLIGAFAYLVKRCRS